jgi:hypothetical protein
MATTAAVSQAPSPPPTRLTAGSTTDGRWGLLADSGFSNPFFYHQFQDDFDNQLGATGLYVSTVVSTGVAPVHAAGDGGIASFVTSATAGSATTIQLPAASISLPGMSTVSPYLPTSSKKVFYMTRISLSNITTMDFMAGLCNTGATFSAGAPSVTDGIYFHKPAGGTALTLTAVASAGQSPTGAGVTYSLVIPTTSFALVNSTFFDIGFYVDRYQNVQAFVGNQLFVGFSPTSGSGGVNSAGVVYNPPNGPAAALNQSYQNTGASAAPPYYLTLANLNLTLGATNGATASAGTMLADFHMFQKER